MNTSFNQLKYFIGQKTILIKLIKINVSVWLFFLFISLFDFLFKNNITENLIRWVAIPANFSLLYTRPWTIITYMFLHLDFFHILFNMLMLFFGGMLFSQYINQKKLLHVYLIGGIFGGLFYVLSFNIFPVFYELKNHSIALGASASVIAIVVAIAVFIPDMSVNLFLLGNVKLKYIAIGLLIIDLISIEKGNSGGHIAHLGGAFYGAIWALNYRYRYVKIPKFDINKIFQRKSTFKIHKNPKGSSRPISDEEYNKQKVERQKRIDQILDKISKSGYDSLTKEEKEFLFSNSNKK
jgi:membrane associated rhomboid family serine protease